MKILCLDDYDQLFVEFRFTRNRMFYTQQMYLPYMLIAALSWVGFWIDHRSTPAIVSLAITTILTVVALGKKQFAISKESTLQTNHEYFMLKRRESGCLHVASTWNIRGVFVGYLETFYQIFRSSIF